MAQGGVDLLYEVAVRLAPVDAPQLLLATVRVVDGSVPDHVKQGLPGGHRGAFHAGLQPLPVLRLVARLGVRAVQAVPLSHVGQQGFGAALGQTFVIGV